MQNPALNELKRIDKSFESLQKIGNTEARASKYELWQESTSDKQ